MKGLYDEDGIDGPWNRAMDRAMKEDAKKIARRGMIPRPKAKGGCPATAEAVEEQGGDCPLCGLGTLDHPSEED